MVIFLVAHEIDAALRHEWRILPLTSFLPESYGRAIFLWAHVPLAILLVWIAAQGVENKPALWLSVFAVIHVALHWVFRKHPKNEFGNPVSWAIICAAGLAGSTHLLAVFFLWDELIIGLPLDGLLITP